jgi:hypothetical protein
MYGVWEFFCFHPSDSFSPPTISILPLVEKFGIYFPNVFSKKNSEFTLGKVRDLNSELLFAWFKGKNGKSRG